MEEVLVNDGKAQFKFEHASEWLIVVNDISHSKITTAITNSTVNQNVLTNEEAVQESVDTKEEAVLNESIEKHAEGQYGNILRIIVIIVVAISVACGIGFAVSKRNESE